MTYPLTVPEGCPDYVAASVQKQCDRFLARALEGESSEEIERSARIQEHEELWAMRQAYDGQGSSNPWWYKWGYRAVAEAAWNAVYLAKFREAMDNPKFAYVKDGHKVAPDHLHVYFHDKTPTGVWRETSIPKGTPGLKALMESRKSR